MYDLITEFYTKTHKQDEAIVLWYSEVYDEVEELLIDVMSALPKYLDEATEILLTLQKLYQDPEAKPEDIIRYMESIHFVLVRYIADIQKAGW